MIVSAERVLAAELPTDALARDVLGQIGAGEATFSRIARAAGGLQPASLSRALELLMTKSRAPTNGQSLRSRRRQPSRHALGIVHKLRGIIQFVERRPTPSLLPIFRSQQQAELLALILSDPAAEFTLAELTLRTGTPYASVHREIERAEVAGLIAVRLVGRTKLVRADMSSPYFEGLSDVLVKAFGPPRVIGSLIADIEGIDAAYIYGSWAARFVGEAGDRPVGDIDLLVLGTPDRDQLYAAASSAEQRLGRAVQVTIRAADWLKHGSGTFHDTVAGRPIVPVTQHLTSTATEDRSPATARPTRQPSAKSSTPTRRHQH